MTDNPRKNARTVRSPIGPDLICGDWTTEAPMRMMMNNLDPDVAENPHELVVYGGIGRAARTWRDFDKIVDTLKTLKTDETLARSIRQAGRCVPHPCGCATGADRQLQPCAGVGQLGPL